MKAIFKAEKRSTLVEQVANQLREAIESGKLEPGDRLIETDIANSMEIGRNAVREAIRYLEKEGLITTTPFKGAHVTVPNIEEIEQTFEVIASLQGICAQLATQRMTDAELQKIEDLHAEIETHYAAQNQDAYLAANGTFHKYIQELTKNRVLYELVAEFRKRVVLYKQRQLNFANRFEASIQEHRKIMDALRQRDPGLAEATMKSHLLRMGRAVVKSYEDEDLK